MMRVRLLSPTLLFAAALSLSLFAAGTDARAGDRPNLASLRLVAELPKELPRRVSSIAFDGQKIWVMVYLGGGRHALLDPSTLEWEVSREKQRHDAISDIAGSFQSPGGTCFAGDRLWIGGSYGDSLGYINTLDWKVERAFKGRRVADDASQMYSALACDGSNVWVAWHWFRYRQPVTRTQVLLKLDPETGQAVAEYPLPAGTRNDGTHALTWDGARLWHMKGSLLSAIEPGTGLVTAQYELTAVKRASGLAWDGRSLWIAEFDGKIWRLSF
jgi:hypothetical protein